METYQVIQTGPGSGQIAGLPANVVKLVQLDQDDPLARRVAHLALHKADLQFAGEFLDALERLPQYHDKAKVGLWRSSIVHYFKCFGDAGHRFQLDPKAVYKDRPPELLRAFELFKSIRNKHIVHDESTYTQCAVAAALNDGTAGETKVERVVALVGALEVRNQENMSNLRALISYADEWIREQLEELITILKRRLNERPYSELAARPPMDVQFKAGSPAGQ